MPHANNTQQNDAVQPDPWPRFPPPEGLRSARFLVEGEDVAVLVFPIALNTSMPQSAELTKAEQSVVQLALEGFSNAEIATLRNARPRTVANQLQAIYGKLGVGSRIELARSLAHVDLAAAEARQPARRRKPLHIIRRGH